MARPDACVHDSRSWTLLSLAMSAILIVAATWSGCANPTVEPPAPVPSPATVSPRDVTSAETQPGELRIAYTSVTVGNSDIYTIRPDGSGQIRLTFHPALDFGPRLRGDDIVFGSLRTGRSILYRVGLSGPVPSGSDPAEVFRNTGGEEVPDWSPDGVNMVFSAERDFNFDIYVTRPDGSPQRRITNDPGRDTSPRWSPDGSRILFVSDRTGNHDVYVINVDGSGERNLTNTAEDEARPNWSPDGSRILFSRTPMNGNPDIFVMDIGSGDEDRRELTGSLGAAEENGVSSGSGEPERDVGGRGARNLTRHPSSWEVVSAWSPDGHVIAFASNRDGNWEIYTMDTTGANVQRLTTNPGFDGDPIWIETR